MREIAGMTGELQGSPSLLELQNMAWEKRVFFISPQKAPVQGQSKAVQGQELERDCTITQHHIPPGQSTIWENNTEAIPGVPNSAGVWVL